MMTAGAAFAQSDCSITGNIEAAPNTENPELGAWQYTLTASWDTGANFALSHMNLLVGAEDRCLCDDLDTALAWMEPAGDFDGETEEEDPCTVSLIMSFECNGDPSLDIDEPLYKFEYVEDTGCEPANIGTLTIVFYSEFAPATIATPNMFLVDKFAQLSCSGEIGGVFPGLPCDPLADEGMDWGTVKSVYNR